MTNESNGAQRPNILYIQSDQHSPNVLGCYGESTVRTPNLDALAARGTVFTSAYCAAPVCVPSRMSFLTGTIPPRERGLGQLPYAELWHTNLRPRDGRGRLSTGTDRQDALHRLRPASRVRRTLCRRP